MNDFIRESCKKYTNPKTKMDKKKFEEMYNKCPMI